MSKAKRRKVRQNMKHSRGKKRCPYCKSNAVVDGRCGSCGAVVKRTKGLGMEVPSLFPNDIDTLASMGLTLVTTALRRRKRNNVDEE